MKKSIGGKIAVVLSALALVFVIAMGLNLAALIAIRDFNNDICNYMEMQQVKGEISIAFQEEKAVLDRVYFNQTGEEFESRRSSILSSMDMIDENLETLEAVCLRAGDSEATELCAAWKNSIQEFNVDVKDFFEKVETRDYVNAKFLMDEFPNQESQIQSAEDALELMMAGASETP